LRFTEDQDIVLRKSSIKKLLDETYQGNLSNIDLAYICDCLTLGERVEFENEVLKEMIFELADPEINGSFKTSEEIEILLDVLNKS
jgi:hypothetical protein